MRIDPCLLLLTLTGRGFSRYTRSSGLNAELASGGANVTLFVGFRWSLGAATNVWLTDHLGLKNIAIGADLEQ